MEEDHRHSHGSISQYRQYFQHCIVDRFLSRSIVVMKISACLAMRTAVPPVPRPQAPRPVLAMAKTCTTLVAQRDRTKIPSARIFPKCGVRFIHQHISV